MRILQAMAGGRHGGAESFFLRLAMSLNRRNDVEQHVLVKKRSVWTAPLRAEKISTQELAFGGLMDLGSKLRFGREIRDFDPDVVLTWMNRATAYCPRRKPGQRFVHVARLGGYYDLKYYRHCDHLVGNTRAIVDYLVAEGWPADRAHYLPNFVDARPLPALPRADFDTPDDAPLLVALGRLHENKALDILIRSLANVPNAYLWIAGEGPERDNLAALARDCNVENRLRLLGWSDDAAALYATADIFVCPSRHEPLGNVVIEAWAQGCPVVAADASGPEALIDDGDNGLLVAKEDVDGLSNALNRLIAEPETRQKLIERGRETWQAEFTEQAVVQHYMDFFATVTEQV